VIRCGLRPRIPAAEGGWFEAKRKRGSGISTLKDAEEILKGCKSICKYPHQAIKAGTLWIASFCIDWNSFKPYAN